MPTILRSQGTVPFGFDRVRTVKHLSRNTATIPATTSEELFAVTNGRILVHLLLGEVTTIIQTQTCNLKVTINPTTGTSADVASNLDVTATEVGGLIYPEGDGTAVIGVDAGTGFSAGGIQNWIVPIGGIDIETSATNTGAIKWDLWFEPLDEDAAVIVS